MSDVNLDRVRELAGHLRDAVRQLRELGRASRESFLWTNLALVYALLGRDHEALAAVEEARKLDPKWSIERWALLPYTNRADRDRDLEALRRAGLE